jgi:hypothetical protein
MSDLVFICYSRKDEDFVLELAKDLKNEGVLVWLDKWNIPSGANWSEEIDKALNECARLVLVLTPSSLESNRVQDEWSSVFEKKKVIVPILHQSCNIPSPLSEIQYIDFTDGSDYKKSLKKLLNAVDAEIQQSRVWTSKAIKGKWDGYGKWNLQDKTWNGIGSWQGGTLMGSWSVKGIWMPLGDDFGDWNGEGEFVCNIEFMNNAENYIIILGSFITLITSALNYYISKVGDAITIMIFLFMVALTIQAIRYTRSTHGGKAWLEGTYRDVGEFRILDIAGKAKLGHHEGVISGKFKDPIPR